MQKAIKCTLYGTKSNNKNHANTVMGMKIDGDGQFDMLKKTGCEPNPNIPLEAIFRQWDYFGASP